MYQVSEEIRKKIDEDRGIFLSKFYLNNTEIEIDATNITLDSPYMDAVGIGNVISSYITINLQNSTADITDAVLTWKIKVIAQYAIENTALGTTDGEFIVDTDGFGIEFDIPEISEEIPMGVYNVMEYTKNRVIAYDNVKKTDIEYVSALAYPNTLANVANEIATLCGITYDTITWPTITIQKAFEADTCRMALSEIAKILGKNAVAGRDGKIRFIYMNDTTLSYDASKYYEGISIGETDMNVTAVVCKKSDGTVLTSGTAGGMAMSFTSDYVTQSMLDNMSANFFKKFRGVECSLLGDPTIDVGDILTIRDIDGVTDYKMPVMNMRFDFDGGMKNDLVSRTETTNETLYKASKGNVAKQVFDLKKDINGVNLLLETEYATKGYVTTQLDISTGQITAEIIESVKEEVVTSIVGIYTLDIQSSSGNVYSEDTANITLTAVLRQSNTDVSDIVDPSVFTWTRISPDSSKDFTWNSQTGRHGKSLVLTQNDLIESCSFRCTVIIPQEVLLVDRDGYYIVDRAGNYITCRVPMDTLACDIPIVETFASYKSKFMQLADRFLLFLDADGRLAYLDIQNNTSSVITLNASNINLQGYITATDLATSGKTTINGENIQTGTLSADKITTGVMSANRLNGGAITGSSINLGNGNFTSDTDGNVVMKKATVDGNIRAYGDYYLRIGEDVTYNNQVLKKIITSGWEYGFSGFPYVQFGDNNAGFVWCPELQILDFYANGADHIGFANTVNFYKTIKAPNLATTTSAANLRAIADGEFRVSSSSSERYKDFIDDIKEESINPNRLYDARVRQFKYRDGYISDGTEHDIEIGFIVEELEQVYPIAVDYNSDGTPEMWNEKYLIPPMLKLIQDQNQRITDLENRLNNLERMMNNG